MSRTSRLKTVLATLVVAALALMPMGEAMAYADATRTVADIRSERPAVADMGGTGDMAGMEGMSAEAGMPCCPDDPAPSKDGCGKSACPAMAACTSQCIPAGPASASGLGPPRASEPSFGLPGVRRLVSIARAPPPRPPRT
ncbi:hypothetical protein [Aureimonas sp. SK2]|uniref:hypothetical protein n=1 Tax=Aureimonas sp. SK2 TaxID=3015992 RepID=UPI002444D7F7|nr:hypothetical protein [Aureimonas sp. SK2]